jgi:hypothetical protein
MNYTIIDVQELENDGVLSGLLFILKVRHPKFGGQLLKHEWNGHPDLSVSEWMALPSEARRNALPSILTQARTDHWAKMEARASGASQSNADYSDVIGQGV